MHLALGYTSGFGGKELYLVDAEDGKNSDGEEHDTQTTQPLGDAAPEEQGVGLAVDIVEDGGSGSGEARHGFEKGIGEAGDVAAQPIGEGAKEGKSYPAEGDGDVAIASRKFSLAILSEDEKP